MDQAFRTQLEESRYLKYPLKEDRAQGGHARWLQKEPTASLELPLADNWANLRLEGPGTLALSEAMTHSGKPSVCLEARMTLPVKHPNNRYYTITVLTNSFAPMDLRAYNRFSVWVYLDAPDYESVMLQYAIVNEGETIMPVPGRFEGIHHDQVIPGAWHRVIWELPDLARDKVTGFTVQLPIAGMLPGGDERIRLYVDDMRMETVEPENTRGFDLRRDAIAYCHSGYLPGTRKQALVQHCGAKDFTLYNEANEAAFQGEVQQLEDGFALLDFTALDAPGRYTIAVGDLESKPFAIGPDAYLSAAWRTLNFFYAERCGFDVPGVHNACHLDVVSRHPDGREVCVAGGWHDAADLSIGTGGTATHVLSILELAQALRDTHPVFYERALEEARWGLNYIMRLRFGDGYRGGGSIIGFWSNNIRGDFDDITPAAENSPQNNMACAAACAAAYPFFQDDRVFARWLRRCAIEDFAFGYERYWHAPRRGADATSFAQASIAAMRLFDLTGEQGYMDIAADFARRVMACQQMELKTEYTMPLRGYFYEDETKARPIAFFHQSAEHTMTECCLRLLKAAPNHAEAAAWRASIEASAEYLRAISHVMPPYGILPAGIYEVGNTDYSTVYHEGDAVGLPTMEEYNAQVKNGIMLDDHTSLRRFPVAYQFRGFHVTMMGKAKAALLLADYLGDTALRDTAIRQVEYILGFNPFAASTVYGEGYDYAPLYGGFAGDVVGAVPVGIETFENDDEPYWPMQSNATYKEIWSHAVGFLMETIGMAISQTSTQ